MQLNLSLDHARSEQPGLLVRLRFSHANEFNAVDCGNGLMVSADLTCAHQGVACLNIVSAESLLDGKITRGQSVYSMECTVSPWMEDTSWQAFCNYYIDRMVAARGDVPALGDMPETCPWVAGFLYPEARALNAKAQRIIQDVARAIAVTAVNLCLDDSSHHTPGREI